eukprot:6413604-Karenia_brevis.AAC.1
MVGCPSEVTQLLSCTRLAWALHVKGLDHFPIHCHFRSNMTHSKAIPRDESIVAKIPKSWRLKESNDAVAFGVDALR